MAHGAARSERMFYVRAVVESRQSAQQIQSPDGAPTNEFDVTVGRIGIGRNEHRAASVLAVVESEEERAAIVPFRVFITAKRERAATQLRDAYEHAEQIPQRAKRLEIAIGECANVRGETEAKNIERIDFAVAMRKANEIDGAGLTGKQRAERGVSAIFGEVAEERVACPKRKKTKRDAILRFGTTEETVQDFVSGAVTADSDEASIALRVRFGSEFRGVAAAGRSDHVDCKTALAQLRERFTGELGGFTAARRGVDDGEKTLLLLGHGYKGSIAEVRSSCASRSARMFLFILSEAVRGKSSSSRTTPWTRL